MDRIATIPVAIILSTIVVAMIGSHFHLSKPYLSFLAVRNFYRSWLSREIVFTTLSFLFTAGLLVSLRFGKRYQNLSTSLGWGAILAGFATVYCMAKIYLLPAQIAWNSAVTIITYFSAMLLLGSTSLIVILLMDLQFSKEESPPDLKIRLKILKSSAIWLTVVAILAAGVVLALGFYQIDLLRNIDHPSAQASLQLILGIYQPLLAMRIGFTVLGIAWLVAVIVYFIKTQKSFTRLLGPVYIGCILVLIGEILERFLFYATHVRTGI